ncbi:40S ribosomal protein S20 [Astathelohania contejeani]|uniref:40S ribosomal protein S20 n=1 Tax=Astathelohania contejeani TaxID=164912 RepID=A0ABQ7HYY9_9MICR|nr:40S ribosomal protein S20 [Thelohania contejeani]
MEVVEKKYEIEERPVDLTKMTVEISLASTNCTLIENICEGFYKYAHSFVPTMKNVQRLKTQVCNVTTRKSPCGQGTNTWNKYTMKIHRRRFTFDTNAEDLEMIAGYLKNSNVEVILKIKS